MVVGLVGGLVSAQFPVVGEQKMLHVLVLIHHLLVMDLIVMGMTTDLRNATCTVVLVNIAVIAHFFDVLLRLVLCAYSGPSIIRPLINRTFSYPICSDDCSIRVF